MEDVLETERPTCIVCGDVADLAYWQDTKRCDFCANDY